MTLEFKYSPATPPPPLAGPAPDPHVVCRQSPYPSAPHITRFPVPDDKVHWDQEFPEYAPVDYTSDPVLATPLPDWADEDVRKEGVEQIKFNTSFNKWRLNRCTHAYEDYEVIKGVPRNPKGRTGVVGRGLLGRWGPNHIVDPILTRWRIGDNGRIKKRDGHPVLEFPSIKRTGTGKWFVPGGYMLEGERVFAALKRVFREGFLDFENRTEEEKVLLDKKIENQFYNGPEMCRGYVDDPRNTDNAWIETIVMNFHDYMNDTLADFDPKPGEGVEAVCWQEIAEDNDEIYHTHKKWVQAVAHLRFGYFVPVPLHLQPPLISVADARAAAEKAAAEAAAAAEAGETGASASADASAADASAADASAADASAADASAADASAAATGTPMETDAADEVAEKETPAADAGPEDGTPPADATPASS